MTDSNMPGPEEDTFLRPEGEEEAGTLAPPPPEGSAPAAAEEGKPAEVGDAMAEIHRRGQLKGKDDIKGRIRVLSRKDLEEIIAGLLKKYGALSSQDLIAQLGALEMQMNQANAKHEKDLDALRAEANAALEAQRKQFEEEMARAREAAEAQVRERLLELERLLEVERGRTADLEAKLAALQAELEKLQHELALAKAALDTDDKRTKADLLKLIEELRARIFELEMALDYFDLEQEFGYDQFVAEAESLAKKLEGAGGDKAMQIFSRAKEIQATGKADHEKFQALLQKMYESKGSIGVVVDLAKLMRRCEAAAARTKDVTLTYENAK